MLSVLRATKLWLSHPIFRHAASLAARLVVDTGIVGTVSWLWSNVFPFGGCFFIVQLHTTKTACKSGKRTGVPAEWWCWYDYAVDT